MKEKLDTRRIDRRRFLKLGAGLVGAAAASAILPTRQPKAFLLPEKVQSEVRKPMEGFITAPQAAPDKHFVATDGWIYIPPPAVPPYHPDNMAPGLLTTYIFGFRDVTELGDDTGKIFAQKMKAQLVSPIFWIDQEADFTLKLTNLGLQVRPDLIDAHTVHFHGFRNAIPIFDGEPHSSVGVPIVRDLTYFYRPHHPGTYMYHCHFEETEHVHMGMVGPVFVRPILNQSYTGRQFAYNDLSTEYDREYVILLNEIWAESHWSDSHVQLPEWSDYRPDFWLMNGRVYPDTIEPNGGGTDLATGDLIAPSGRPELQYQPISSLIQCNSGERVLIRLINLGYEEQSMKLTGLKMRVVGRDAMPLQSPTGEDLSFLTDVVSIGPGESMDAIFVAPEVSSMTRLLFHNRDYSRLSNGGGSGYGGQMTEVHIYPAGELGPQTEPNAWATV
ncbi:MAG: multicopper oxidase domain-containing protein [Chloroflexi bacterium]|nr:multicopper oxidase domain-containing protein [Chloroflexota bacterium]